MAERNVLWLRRLFWKSDVRQALSTSSSSACLYYFDTAAIDHSQGHILIATSLVIAFIFFSFQHVAKLMQWGGLKHIRHGQFLKMFENNSVEPTPKHQEIERFKQYFSAFFCAVGTRDNSFFAFRFVPSPTPLFLRFSSKQTHLFHFQVNCYHVLYSAGFFFCSSSALLVEVLSCFVTRVKVLVCRSSRRSSFP